MSMEKVIETEENMYKANLPWKKKYVRWAEGAELFSMSLTKFKKTAREAEAVYKVDKLVLVNVEEFENYLRTFKLVPERRALY